MDYALELIKIVVALVGVLSLFYLLVKFIKKKNFLNQTNQIKVLERCYLGSNKIIYLVKVVEDIWLVSATDDKIEFVREVELNPEEMNFNQEQGVLDFFRKDKNEDEANES